ncbi:MAG: hypothetical protein GXZ14_00955 [Ruminococcaceae bacterium]|nr:hypothetical protein [Oscillospiraceae bacterium]
MKKINKAEPAKVQIPLDCYECAYNGDCDYLNAKSLMPDAFEGCPTKEEEL